jgi:hypothetical protein
MSGVVCMVLNESVSVKFDVLGEVYIRPPKEAKALVQGLLIAGKANLIFTEIVIARNFMCMDENNRMESQLAMANYRGPFTSKEFLEMMKIDELGRNGIMALERLGRNVEWYNHLDQIISGFNK